MSCIVHLIWGTSVEQPWNNFAKLKAAAKDAEEAVEGQELITMKSEKEEANSKEMTSMMVSTTEKDQENKKWC